MSQSLLYKISGTKFHPICFSDHAPLELTIDWPAPRSKFARWYFPNYLRSNRLLRDELRKTITDYFDLNDPEHASLASNWDAFKAVIRGKCIELEVTLKMQRKGDHLLLESELRFTENDHKASPSIQTLHKVTQVKGKLQAIYPNGAEKTFTPPSL